MAQLYWHKSQLVTLGPKIEALPDNHPSKLQCLWGLAQFFDLVGNLVDCKRLLCHSLMLGSKQGNDFQVARALANLSNVDQKMGMYEEGIRQVGEVSKIFKRLGYVTPQAYSLINLTWLLCKARQLNAMEEVGSRAIGLLPEEGGEIWACRGHQVLGEIYQSKGKMKKAIHHFKIALGFASSLNVVRQLIWVNSTLAVTFSERGESEDAQAHLDHAKSHAVDDTYLLVLTIDQQARLWYKQHKFEDAKSKALRAIEAFERLGAANDAEATRQFLYQIKARQSGCPWQFKWQW